MYHRQASAISAGGGRGGRRGGGSGYASSNSSRISCDPSLASGAMSAMSVGSAVGNVKLPAQGILRLHIVRAESLPHVHLSPTTGPYLALRFGKTRHKTRICTNGGVNPQWNECFELYVSSSDVRKQSVLFTVKNKKSSSSSSSRSVGSGQRGGGGADDDSRSILSTLTGSTSNSSGSVLGVANVKLLSLCAKERTLLIPLRQIGGGHKKKSAGCLTVRVSFEAWNAGRTAPSSVGGLGRSVGSGAGVPRVTAGTAGTAGGGTALVPRLSHPPPRPPPPPTVQQQPAAPVMTRRPSWQQMAMDQRDDDYYGGRPPIPPPPPPPPPVPVAPPPVPVSYRTLGQATGRRSGLPPRGPSVVSASARYVGCRAANGTGGYHRLEESLDDLALVDATPAYRRSGGKVVSSKHHQRSSSRQKSSRPSTTRGGGGRARHRGERDYDRRSYRRGGTTSRGRSRREYDDEDGGTDERDDVPSMVDVFDEDDVSVDESEVSGTIDHRGRRSRKEELEGWERAVASSRARVYGNPRDALVSTSKFLCF